MACLVQLAVSNPGFGIIESITKMCSPIAVPCSLRGADNPGKVR